MNVFSRSVFILLSLFVCLIATSNSLFAQGKTKKPKNEKISEAVVVGVGSGGSSGYKNEPSLILEPCAKESEEQISALENAADLIEQLRQLVGRSASTDEWVRACAIYRLGEFKKAASPAIPTIIKLLRDENIDGVWVHVETSFWKIPPNGNQNVAQRLNDAASLDIYKRLEALHALAHTRIPAGSNEAKDILSAFISAANDDDETVRWLGVMGIRQLGFDKNDTSSAIPVLSKLLVEKKGNPIHPVRAFYSMGKNAMLAGELLLDVLFNTDKYVEANENGRSYGVYLTTAMALGNLGEPLVPILEKKSAEHPLAVIQVLSNMRSEKSFDLHLRLCQSNDRKVKLEAISKLPGLTSIGALKVLPILLPLLDGSDEKLRDQAINQIGRIGTGVQNKSPELRTFLSKKIVPKLMRSLDGKDKCYSMFSLGHLGELGVAALPKIAKLAETKDDGCAELAIYYYGDLGKKYLSETKWLEIMKERKQDEVENLNFFNNQNKAKPIAPKVEKQPEKFPEGIG